MRRLILCAITLFLFCGSADAGMIIRGSGELSFCSGTYLFCEDFEDEDTAWGTVSTTYDCDLDTAGDYCDDYSASGLSMAGDECLGTYGHPSYRLYTSISATSEFTLKTKLRVSGSAKSVYIYGLQDVGNNFGLLLVTTSTAGYLRLYYNNTAANIVATTSQLSTDTTYDLVIYYKAETTDEDNDGVLKAKINGSEVISESALNLRTNSADQLRFTCGGTSITAFTDNFILYSGDQY